VAHCCEKQHGPTSKLLSLDDIIYDTFFADMFIHYAPLVEWFQPSWGISLLISPSKHKKTSPICSKCCKLISEKLKGDGRQGRRNDTRFT
jgi:hypothetical protein